MRINATKKPISWALVLLCILISCSPVEEPQAETPPDSLSVADTVTPPADDLLVFRFNYAVANIPSAQTLLADLEGLNIPFREDFMAEEEIMSASLEETERKAAMLIGINNADIVYSLIKRQNSDLIRRINYALNRIDRLGLSTVMEKETLENLSKTGVHRDSVAEVLDRLSIRLDRYLRDNKRVLTASLIFAGSWMEALHLMVKTREISDKKTSLSIQKYLYDQRLHLENLIKLLTEIKNDPYVSGVTKNLKNLQAALLKTGNKLETDASQTKEFTQELTSFRDHLLRSESSN